MSGDDHPCSGLARRFGEQAVAGGAGGGGNAARRMGPLPLQDAGAGAQVFGGSRGEGGPGGAGLLQAMVNAKGDDSAVVFPGPGHCLAKGQHGVGAAGYGHREGALGSALKPPVEWAQAHRARVRAVRAWVFRAAVAVG